MKPPTSHSKRLSGHASDSIPQNQKDYYEGERLARLLQSLQREIESARLADGKAKALPEKIWFKYFWQQQFAIGVNEVTRALERMKPPPQHFHETDYEDEDEDEYENDDRLTITKPSSTHLQAVVVASDSNPKWLTKHLPSLASSRKVPLIFLRDNKHASLRLAQLFKLKSAIAIGIKARGNSINKFFAGILRGDGDDLLVNDGTDCCLTSRLPSTSTVNMTFL
ncbi:uncharacterized protein LOC21397047 isoform X1 [Morus notabilis]|uniref:uncharacterized protein LOC21397047 isoform X1 n=1 Tax=Morus notabilis TaxID=981085 RepID=UPI000CECF631|nr:uncharacterized protein LOC21397047 isoform X1 [Morus notabilis]